MNAKLSVTGARLGILKLEPAQVASKDTECQLMVFAQASQSNPMEKIVKIITEMYRMIMKISQNNMIRKKLTLAKTFQIKFLKKKLLIANRKTNGK